MMPGTHESNRSPTRVLIALGVPLLRMGVAAALETAEDCRVVGTTAGPDEIIPAVERLRPDIVILDTDYHRADTELIPRITGAHPVCRVLVLVNHSDEECVIRSLLSRPDAPRLSPDALDHLNECCLLALRSSARGCAPKVGEPERLVHAIRTVMAGEIAAGPWLDAIMLSSSGERRFSSAGSDRISARELDVITLVAKGLENKEIAEYLGIREQTVKNHLGRVMRKLDLRNRQELAIYAVKQHLVHPG
jgi:DNA-binding NarL/FixJ family response regulator